MMQLLKMVVVEAWGEEGVWGGREGGCVDMVILGEMKAVVWNSAHAHCCV